MKNSLKTFCLFLLVAFSSACTTEPKKVDYREKNTVALEKVEPLANELDEQQEFDFALDVVSLELKNKRFDKAYRLLTKLKKNQPNDIRVYRNYVRYYQLIDDTEMAYLSARTALTKSGATQKDEDIFAKLALMTENYVEAEDIYQNWLDDTQDEQVEVIAMNNLGFSALLQKDFDRAKGYFNQALVKDPLNEKARNNLQLIKQF